LLLAEDIRTSLVSYKDDMSRVPNVRGVKANYILQQEIKLGTYMQEILIVNYKRRDSPPNQRIQLIQRTLDEFSEFYKIANSKNTFK